MENNTEKKENFGTKMGYLIGSVFVGCMALCLCACMVAATVTFVMWIF